MQREILGQVLGREAALQRREKERAGLLGMIEAEDPAHAPRQAGRAGGGLDDLFAHALGQAVRIDRTDRRIFAQRLRLRAVDVAAAGVEEPGLTLAGGQGRDEVRRAADVDTEGAGRIGLDGLGGGIL